MSTDESESSFEEQPTLTVLRPRRQHAGRLMQRWLAEGTNTLANNLIEATDQNQDKKSTSLAASLLTKNYTEDQDVDSDSFSEEESSEDELALEQDMEQFASDEEREEQLTSLAQQQEEGEEQSQRRKVNHYKQQKGTPTEGVDPFADLIAGQIKSTSSVAVKPVAKKRARINVTENELVNRRTSSRQASRTDVKTQAIRRPSPKRSQTVTRVVRREPTQEERLAEAEYTAQLNRERLEASLALAASDAVIKVKKRVAAAVVPTDDRIGWRSWTEETGNVKVSKVAVYLTGSSNVLFNI